MAAASPSTPLGFTRWVTEYLADEEGRSMTSTEEETASVNILAGEAENSEKRAEARIGTPAFL